jgi:hypothetical protein
MVEAYGKNGRQQSSEQMLVDQEEDGRKKTSVEVVRRCGGGLERDRSEEMED